MSEMECVCSMSALLVNDVSHVANRVSLSVLIVLASIGTVEVNL